MGSLPSKGDVLEGRVITGLRRRRPSQEQISGWLSNADQLKGCNDLKANTARICLEGDGEHYLIRHEPATVDRNSTTHTLLGTILAAVALLFLSIYFLHDFAHQVPSVSAVQTEVFDQEYKMPDVAITLSAAGMSIPELLTYVHPTLEYRAINQAFIKDGQTQTRERWLPGDEFRFGEACNLPVAHEADMWHPAFCIMGSSFPLRGWFGDEVWKYFNLNIERCSTSEDYLHPRLAALWNGTCRSETELRQAIGTSGFFKFNLWFRFEREGWEQSYSLLGPRGMIGDDWTWYVYNKVSFVQPISYHVKMRYNKAIVHSRWMDLDSLTTKHEWFDYGSHLSGAASVEIREEDCVCTGDFSNVELSMMRLTAASGSSRYDDHCTCSIDEALISFKLRIDRMGRHVEVKYQTILNVIATVSGSWAICLVLGATFTTILKRCTPLPEVPIGATIEEETIGKVTPVDEDGRAVASDSDADLWATPLSRSSGEKPAVKTSQIVTSQDLQRGPDGSITLNGALHGVMVSAP